MYAFNMRAFHQLNTRHHPHPSQVGVKYGGYLRRDIRSAMSRDELPRATVLGARHEIVRNFLTPGDIRATIEFGEKIFLYASLLYLRCKPELETNSLARAVFETEPCKRRGVGGHVEDCAALDWKLIDIVLIAMAPEGSAARSNTNMPGPHYSDSSSNDDLR